MRTYQESIRIGDEYLRPLGVASVSRLKSEYVGLDGFTSVIYVILISDCYFTNLSTLSSL